MCILRIDYASVKVYNGVGAQIPLAINKSITGTGFIPRPLKIKLFGLSTSSPATPPQSRCCATHLYTAQWGCARYGEVLVRGVLHGSRGLPAPLVAPLSPWLYINISLGECQYFFSSFLEKVLAPSCRPPPSVFQSLTGAGAHLYTAPTGLRAVQGGSHEGGLI